MELLLISLLRALVEVAGMFLLGQGVLYLLAGASRHQNFVYQLFGILTRPVIKVTRMITPKVIIDKHIGVVAFFLLFWLWIGLNVLKRYLCISQGLDCPA